MSPAAKKYYSGGIRFVRDGVPCRMASWVNDLTEISRADMLRPTDMRRTGYSPPVGGASGAQREAGRALRHPETTYLPLEAFQ